MLSHQQHVYDTPYPAFLDMHAFRLRSWLRDLDGVEA